MKLREANQLKSLSTRLLIGNSKILSCNLLHHEHKTKTEVGIMIYKCIADHNLPFVLKTRNGKWMETEEEENT